MKSNLMPQFRAVTTTKHEGRPTIQLLDHNQDLKLAPRGVRCATRAAGDNRPGGYMAPGYFDQFRTKVATNIEMLQVLFRG